MRGFDAMLRLMGFPKAELSDSDLLCAVARRDEAAFSELYDRTSPVVFGLILRMISAHAEAEDVLQKTFLRVWDRAPYYVAEMGTPFTWIVTIARNLAIDHLRADRRTRDGQLRNQALEAAVHTVHTANGFKYASQLEKNAAVRQVLDTLEPTEREAIEWAFFQGLTHEEIAQASGAPVGTVKARIRRGMAKLKKPLASLRLETVG